MKIFLICPVRGITDEERVATMKYVADLEADGHSVHWPPRNTDQNDPIGLRICQDNRRAILNADEVHIWWNEKSQGSLFDFGMAFAVEKKITLVNANFVQETPQKSFSNVLRKISSENLSINKEGEK